MLLLQTMNLLSRGRSYLGSAPSFFTFFSFSSLFSLSLSSSPPDSVDPRAGGSSSSSDIIPSSLDGGVDIDADGCSSKIKEFSSLFSQILLLFLTSLMRLATFLNKQIAIFREEVTSSFRFSIGFPSVVELEFEVFVFVEGGKSPEKPENPERNPRS